MTKYETMTKKIKQFKEDIDFLNLYLDKCNILENKGGDMEIFIFHFTERINFNIVDDKSLKKRFIRTLKRIR